VWPTTLLGFADLERLLAMPVNVLIVEENPQARAFMERVVRESFSDALNVTAASDLDAARRAISASKPPADPALEPAQPFDIMLIDLDLPDGHALTLLTEVARHPSRKVVTTLYADDEHLFPALQQGVNGYLLKEDRFEVLIEALQKIVRGIPPVSPAMARRMLAHFREDTGGRQALTSSEVDVLTHLSKGFTVKEIANLMKIKWAAVSEHTGAVCKKLSASARASDSGQ
jgi:DNA-binding NarL/FixJ family response regulator